MSGGLVIGNNIYFQAIMCRNFHKPLYQKKNYDGINNISMS